jgi:glycosyltransferase involved in cell wall biosynthesis
VSDRPLRVAVDANPLLRERTGVGHFTASIVDGLASRDDVAVSAYAISRTGRHDLGDKLPPGVRVATSWVPARVAQALWARTRWPRVEYWTGTVDVVHATNFVAPPSRAPVVVTVHDLAFAHSPELCRPEALRYDGLLRQAIQHGAHVHAVSDFVAGEVREHFHMPGDRVTRVYAGASPLNCGDAANGRRIATSASYILALGTIEPRKNLPELVSAFDYIAERLDDLVLVVAGPDGWGVESFDDAVARARFGARVRRLGYVTDAERADLLAGASVLAYPSLYEGFGHPPLEAMAAGVPVVTARAGALPEAVGDAALLVEPTDVDALADALTRALTDSELRAQLVARGHERVRKFPWARALDELVALYRHVAE